MVSDVLAGVRRASPADNDLLIDLMAHVPMAGPGSLAVSTRRDPDFFALYAMQRGSARGFVYDDGKMAGMATALVREGWLDGRAGPVGYLGDLRIRGVSRARRAFPFLYGKFFQDICDDTGCDSFLTAVLAGNALALSSLTARKRGRAAQPYYHLLRRFEMASVQVVLPPRSKTIPGVQVTTATPDDVAAVAAFLDRDHRQRLFGYRFDDGELEHRLAHWPGFSLEQTFVARSDGHIVGVCTAWDSAPVKRHRVVRYARDMHAVKLAIDVASLVLRCPRLPRQGDDFRSLYLTNLSVKDDAPLVLRALLQRVYALAWQRRVHFFSLPLDERDPLAPAIAGLIVRRLGFHLYAVTSSAKPRIDWPAGRTGFEMALA